MAGDKKDGGKDDKKEGPRRWTIPTIPSIEGSADLARLLVRFLELVNRRAPVRRLRTQFGDEIRRALPDGLARRLGIGEEAAVLRASVRRDFLGMPGHNERFPLRMAATTALVRLAQHGGVVGGVALDALVSGAVRLDGRREQLLDDIVAIRAALGVHKKGVGPAAVVSAARAAIPRGGIPESSRFRGDLRCRIVNWLFPFGLRAVTVPESVAWVPDPDLKGVASGRPFVNLTDRTTATPWFLLPGSRIPERFHVGPGNLFVVSGALEEGGKRYLRPSRRLFLPGTVHSPVAVGDHPAVVITLDEQGAVPTGLRGGRGAELLARVGLETSWFLRYLDGVPPDTDDSRPVAELVQLLFRYLDWLDFSGQLSHDQFGIFLIAANGVSPPERLAAVQRLIRP